MSKGYFYVRWSAKGLQKKTDRSTLFAIRLFPLRQSESSQLPWPHQSAYLKILQNKEIPFKSIMFINFRGSIFKKKRCPLCLFLFSFKKTFWSNLWCLHDLYPSWQPPPSTAVFFWLHLIIGWLRSKPQENQRWTSDMTKIFRPWV